MSHNYLALLKKNLKFFQEPYCLNRNTGAFDSRIQFLSKERRKEKLQYYIRGAFKAGTRQNFVVLKSDDIPSEGGSLKNQPGK